MDQTRGTGYWRSVKYEEVYLNEYNNPREARAGIERYLTFYNQVRPHQALGYKTPETIYKDTGLKEPKAVSPSATGANV